MKGFVLLQAARVIFTILSAFIPIVMEFIRMAVEVKDAIIDAVKNSGGSKEEIDEAKANAREDVVVTTLAEFSSSPPYLPEFVIRVGIEVAAYIYKMKKRDKQVREKTRQDRAMSKGHMHNPRSINIFGVMVDMNEPPIEVSTVAVHPMDVVTFPIAEVFEDTAETLDEEDIIRDAPKGAKPQIPAKEAKKVETSVTDKAKRGRPKKDAKMV